MKKLKLVGAIVILLGVTGIIASQTVKFTRTQITTALVKKGDQSITVEDLQTKNIVLFCGVALVLAGSGCIALDASKLLVVS